MLKSKKKVVKKQKPKTTQKQKQKQTQNTKVVVNIGKTKKTKSSKPAPAPARPQIIPIYTPTYQSQPQQQNPPYNLEDFRTLFKARESTRPNIQQEILRDVVEQTQAPVASPLARLQPAPAPRPAPAPLPVAEPPPLPVAPAPLTARQRQAEARERQRAEAVGRREGDILARGEELIAEAQRRGPLSQAPAPAPAPPPPEDIFFEPPAPEEEPPPQLDAIQRFINPPAQAELGQDYLAPVINRPAVEFVDDAELARQLQAEQVAEFERLRGRAGQPDVARDLNAFFEEPPPPIDEGRWQQLDTERQVIEQGFYPPPAPAFDDLLKQGAQPAIEPEDDEFFEFDEEGRGQEKPEEEPEEEPPAGGGGGGGGGRAEEPEPPPQDDLNELSLNELKEIVRRYNRDNETTKIQITRPNTTGTGTRGKNKDEIISELRAKRYR